GCSCCRGSARSGRFLPVRLVGRATIALARVPSCPRTTAWHPGKRPQFGSTTYICLTCVSTGWEHALLSAFTTDNDAVTVNWRCYASVHGRVGGLQPLAPVRRRECRRLRRQSG